MHQARVRGERTRLPVDFSPSSYSVLIGRGKICSEAIGTRRLKVIASRYLEEYSTAHSQLDKAAVISKIVETIQEACPVGAFLKYEDGGWWEVSDCAAREKVGVVLRDLLHEQYKSSTKSKSAMRKKKRVSFATVVLSSPNNALMLETARDHGEQQTSLSFRFG